MAAKFEPKIGTVHLNVTIGEYNIVISKCIRVYLCIILIIIMYTKFVNYDTMYITKQYI